VIIRSAHTDKLAAMVPNARVTRLAGPAGWNEAVIDLVNRDLANGR